VTKAQIVGWAHSAFGKSAAPDTETLMAEVTGPALAHAGVEASDVDHVFVGVYNNGFSRQDFQAALVGMANPALGATPATRFENACATGSAALFGALAELYGKEDLRNNSGHRTRLRACATGPASGTWIEIAP